MHYPKLIKRVHAWIIDSCLFFFIILGSLLLPNFIGIEDALLKLVMIVLPIISFEPILITFTGGTLGHHYAGLKIVDSKSQNRLSLVKSYIRFIIKILLGTYSFFMMLITKRHQAAHDLFSGSLVLFKNPETVSAAYKLEERKVDFIDQKPPLIRRALVVIVICFLCSFLLGIIVISLVSQNCIHNDICSVSEENILIWLGSVVIIMIIGVAIAGFLGKLPGARIKRSIPAKE